MKQFEVWCQSNSDIIEKRLNHLQKQYQNLKIESMTGTRERDGCSLLYIIVSYEKLSDG